MSLNFDILDNPGIRKEEVAIDAGILWVWELQTGEWAAIRQNSARPSVDPRGGFDDDQVLINQILFSCRAGEAEGSPLVFGDDKGPGRIRKLRRHDFQAIMDAFNRVNGTEASEVEEARGFFDPSEESKNGSSEPSASVASAV